MTASPGAQAKSPEGEYTLVVRRFEMKIFNRAGICPGINVRVSGGYAVVAPSARPDTGRHYRWEVGHHPIEVSIAAAPDWLLDLIVRTRCRQYERCRVGLGRGRHRPGTRAQALQHRGAAGGSPAAPSGLSGAGVCARRRMEQHGSTPKREG